MLFVRQCIGITFLSCRWGSRSSKQSKENITEMGTVNRNGIFGGNDRLKYLHKKNVASLKVNAIDTHRLKEFNFTIVVNFFLCWFALAVKHVNVKFSFQNYFFLSQNFEYINSKYVSCVNINKWNYGYHILFLGMWAKFKCGSQNDTFLYTQGNMEY